MAKKKVVSFNEEVLHINKNEDSRLNLFDLQNPDINMFNAVDDEMIKLSGSKILIYKWLRDDNYDDVYEENRMKVIDQSPVIVYGHYDPRPIEESMTEFGIEITNDQTFTFNKAYLEAALDRPLIAGDIIKPEFQNIFYDVFEVQEDNFSAYGVYHLLASAKVLRDVAKVFPDRHIPEDSATEF
tara:strand:+ start:85 stop:636 length:552 start_codon:yes stop_codon:yes gene_type:complete